MGLRLVDMPKDLLDHVINNLLNCALSYGAFPLADDVNVKLSVLQQIDKEYSSLQNKLKSNEIGVADLEAAVPEVKRKLPAEIDRRQDFNLNIDSLKKLQQSGPGKVDQIVTFLKQKRKLEIKTSLVFAQPPESEES